MLDRYKLLVSGLQASPQFAMRMSPKASAQRQTCPDPTKTGRFDLRFGRKLVETGRKPVGFSFKGSNKIDHKCRRRKWLVQTRPTARAKKHIFPTPIPPGLCPY